MQEVPGNRVWRPIDGGKREEDIKAGHEVSSLSDWGNYDDTSRRQEVTFGQIEFEVTAGHPNRNIREVGVMWEKSWAKVWARGKNGRNILIKKKSLSGGGTLEHHSRLQGSLAPVCQRVAGLQLEKN